MIENTKFEQALKSECAKLNKLNFLRDGKVDYATLCTRLIARHGFSQADIDDAIQDLKQQKIGMVSMSRGHNKVWLELREA